jgi:hypothetical protein
MTTRATAPLLALLAVLLAAAGSYRCASAAIVQRTPPSPPSLHNVLLIAVDDLRPNLRAAYNMPTMHTPAIDQLAAESTVFRHAYCQMAVCSPSRCVRGVWLASVVSRIRTPCIIILHSRSLTECTCARCCARTQEQFYVGEAPGHDESVELYRLLS